MRKLHISVLTILFTPLLTMQALAKSINSGEVTKVDLANHLLFITTECDCGSGKIVEMTLTLDEKTKLLLNGKTAKLSDLKTGDQVDVEYEDTEEVTKVEAKRSG